MGEVEGPQQTENLRSAEGRPQLGAPCRTATAGWPIPAGLISHTPQTTDWRRRDGLQVFSRLARPSRLLEQPAGQSGSPDKCTPSSSFSSAALHAPARCLPPRRSFHFPSAAEIRRRALGWAAAGAGPSARSGGPPEALQRCMAWRMRTCSRLGLWRTRRSTRTMPGACRRDAPLRRPLQAAAPPLPPSIAADAAGGCRGGTPISATAAPACAAAVPPGSGPHCTETCRCLHPTIHPSASLFSRPTPGPSSLPTLRRRGWCASSSTPSTTSSTPGCR